MKKYENINTFPASPDPLIFFQDIDISHLPVYEEVKALITEGRYSDAMDYINNVDDIDGYYADLFKLIQERIYNTQLCLKLYRNKWLYSTSIPTNLIYDGLIWIDLNVGTGAEANVNDYVTDLHEFTLPNQRMYFDQNADGTEFITPSTYKSYKDIFMDDNVSLDIRFLEMEYKYPEWASSNDRYETVFKLKNGKVLKLHNNSMVARKHGDADPLVRSVRFRYLSSHSTDLVWGKLSFVTASSDVWVNANVSLEDYLSPMETTLRSMKRAFVAGLVYLGITNVDTYNSMEEIKEAVLGANDPIVETISLQSDFDEVNPPAMIKTKGNNQVITLSGKALKTHRGFIDDINNPVDIGDYIVLSLYHPIIEATKTIAAQRGISMSEEPTLSETISVINQISQL